jgi:hypothetical protein
VVEDAVEVGIRVAPGGWETVSVAGGIVSCFGLRRFEAVHVRVR